MTQASLTLSCVRSSSASFRCSSAFSAAFDCRSISSFRLRFLPARRSAACWSWLSRDRALAEDVVQETMLRAWKAQDSLLDEGAAKPWFLTIIRREYARTFERKRFLTVDVDELIAREEPMLAAADDHAVEELRATLFKLPDE